MPRRGIECFRGIGSTRPRRAGRRGLPQRAGDGQGLAQQPAGAGVVAQVLLQQGEVVQREHVVGVVLALDVEPQPQHLLEQQAGAGDVAPDVLLP